MLLVFIGYILIFFRVPIGNFILDPAFAGYFLIFLGLLQMRKRSDRFGFGALVSLVMSLLSLVSFFQPIFHFSISPVLDHILTDVILLGRICILLMITLGAQEIQDVITEDLGIGRLKIAWLIQAIAQLVCGICVWISAPWAMGLISIMSFVLTLSTIVTAFFLYSLQRM